MDDDGLTYEDVCADSEVEEGQIRGLRVAGEPVVVGRVGGRLYAIGGTCTHRTALLEEGGLHGKMVLCPLHDSAFDLTTGRPLCPPATRPVPTFAVKVEGGRVLVSREPR
jgi:3-phenylpropionate/trans-cinnamate dioxygenase ferredoxin subunit